MLRRFSIHGDFWLHYLRLGARYCPWFLEPMIIFGFSGFFWVLLNKTRNAVAANLRVVIPGSSWIMSQLRVFRVFWNYSWTLADYMHVSLGDDHITWEVAGKEHLEALEQAQHGAILLTAHMGNYDVAAPFFAPRFGRRIHIVRVPERTKESHEFEHARRAEDESQAFQIHYNEPGNMLGVELARCLAENEIVAIQGDRVLFDVSAVDSAFHEGVSWPIPRGPFMLGLIANVAIYPVFIIYIGYQRYRVEAFPAIEIPRGREGRDAAIREAMQRWSHVLRDVVEQHWWQWLVFEPVFTTHSETSREPAKAMPPSKVDVVIPPAIGRTATEAFVPALGIGLWSFLLIAVPMLQHSDAVSMLPCLLLLPIAWFLMWVLAVNVIIATCVGLLRLLRWPPDRYSLIAGSQFSVAATSLAWWEMSLKTTAGWWLGMTWFVGFPLYLLWRLKAAKTRKA